MDAEQRNTLLEHWQQLWREAGAMPGPALFDALIDRYREPHRKYHTLQHLGECLANFQQLAAVAAHPVEVGLALWFHDAIYDLGRHDNEACSADWAHAEMLAAGLPAAMADRVADLILATCHNTTPVGIDAEVVVDIDLWILGAPAGRFDEYERQVREEYGHLADEVFRVGRLGILQQFLERPKLFSTAVFFEHHEGQARDNLSQSMAALTLANSDPRH
ncbi:MAG: N-methyl-D-aspartate receptor subunit [Moraxellaceae bacterium]|jgi:predicted metal-dependent HD superfamily phosphohydrolase|nr:N-methyl-D-aspartate receptor subunit [Moraxellaceae bacterium]